MKNMDFYCSPKGKMDAWGRWCRSVGGKQCNFDEKCCCGKCIATNSESSLLALLCFNAWLHSDHNFTEVGNNEE